MTGEPRAPARPSRVARSEARARRRRVIAIVAAVALVGAGAWFLTRGGDPGGGDVDASDGGPAPATRNQALAISVRGAAVPLIAVIGGGASPTILTVPPKLSIEVPGVGSGTTEDVAGQRGRDMRTSLSNTLGMWVDHYAVLDLDGLANAIDRVGGVRVTMPGPATLGSSTVGPGAVTLTGAQVREYLGIDGPNAFTRWEVVLTSLSTLRLQDGESARPTTSRGPTSCFAGRRTRPSRPSPPRS
jgi:hypothetical protein